MRYDQLKGALQSIAAAEKAEASARDSQVIMTYFYNNRERLKAKICAPSGIKTPTRRMPVQIRPIPNRAEASAEEAAVNGRR